MNSIRRAMRLQILGDLLSAKDIWNNNQSLCFCLERSSRCFAIIRKRGSAEIKIVARRFSRNNLTARFPADRWRTPKDKRRQHHSHNRCGRNEVVKRKPAQKRPVALVENWSVR